MNLLARVADRAIGRPLLIHPAKAELIASVIADRIGLDMPRVDVESVFSRMRDDVPAANRMVGEPVMDGRDELYRRADGVGIIPVVGTLVNRGLAIGEDWSGFTSYESIALQLRAAMADPKVKSILFDIDSPGGEATGMFALAQLIRAARAEKPITALVNDMAASAAYGIASSATDIAISPTSIAGSIGVVLMHVDKSGEMEQRGRKPTLIFAGAHKVDGHPFGPLTEQVRADMQREVDTFYARFIEQVSMGRPSLTNQHIRGTEARIFIGHEAIDAGLADRLGTFDETLARLQSANAPPRIQTGVTLMTNANQNQDAISRADHDAAIEAARTVARTEGEAAGRTATIERVRSILSCPEAEGREAQARVFALDTDMNPEAAAKALAAAPIPPKGAPSLAARGNEPVAGSQPTDRRESPEASWDAVVANVNADQQRARNQARRH